MECIISNMDAERYLKRAVMAISLADNALSNIVRSIFKTRYKVRGNCLKCGQCCRQIYLKVSRRQAASPLFARLSIKWIEWLFDFRLKWIDYEDDYFVFECLNQKQDGTCGNYFWRPGICRNFPLADFFKEPVFIPGCGFSSEIRP